MTKQSKFISGLFDLLQDNSHNHIISWDENGSAIIIKDPRAMPNVLKQYFKDVTLKSFFRKLFQYGFVIKKDVYKQKMYRHEYFNKNMDIQDIRIQRRNKIISQDIINKDAKDLDFLRKESHQLMEQLSELKQHQNRMSDSIKQTLQIQEQACKCINRCQKHLMGRCNVCHRYKPQGKSIFQPLFQILLSHQQTFYCNDHVEELIKTLPPQEIYTPLNQL